jgi:abhydrolase domain-containing protein 12
MGFAANKTINLKIRTADNETLGSWFILSDPYYRSLSSIPFNSEFDTHITSSLERHPTLLFLHGNAATRAFHARIQHYQGFSSRLSANVLAIDYRGFGDSTGHPSEAGLVRDGRAAWDWLVSRGAKQENIIIIGHSLGTGVTSQLAAELYDEGIKPRGIVLLSVRSRTKHPLASVSNFVKYSHFLAFAKC